MPTQSLVLRGVIGRRLTIAEMDGNFTYLESLAQSGGGTGSSLRGLISNISSSFLVIWYLPGFALMEKIVFGNYTEV